MEATITLTEPCEECGGTRKTKEGKACKLCLGSGKRQREIPLPDLAARVRRLMTEDKHERD